MVLTEFYKILANGITLNRTYSTLGMYIERDGVMYSEAIDNAAFGYEYTETDILIEDEQLGGNNN